MVGKYKKVIRYQEYYYSSDKEKIMKINILLCPVILLFIFQIFCAGDNVSAQEYTINPTLDDSVKSFLEEKRGSWRDMNVPESDGKILYDIIIKTIIKMLWKSAPPPVIQASGLPGL